jgi:hypothetical protein
MPHNDAQAPAPRQLGSHRDFYFPHCVLFQELQNLVRVRIVFPPRLVDSSIIRHIPVALESRDATPNSHEVIKSCISISATVQSKVHLPFRAKIILSTDDEFRWYQKVNKIKMQLNFGPPQSWQFGAIRILFLFQGGRKSVEDLKWYREMNRSGFGARLWRDWVP